MNRSGSLHFDTVKKPGSQLGFLEDWVKLHWFGVPGLRWPGVWSTLLQKDRRPEVLVIHAGGNDMRLRSQRELVLEMKLDLDKIRRLFPDLVLVWSEMVPRMVWRYARNGEKMDRSRGKVLASFVRKCEGIVVRHTILEGRMPAYYREDRVHLSNVALEEGIEQALGHLSGRSCHT
ncbi:hypothetical protein XELAEV_18012383mg [Xenopus laevis]|uniref:SGNH hydrolase-type esterase domain-containing protein n=1 Tax=Xenopus laevis TaxID=8355 RepID=A0A974HYM8_XENLA|nr:hypothetical protein XELAEV_18012383mg [Xenopus laevis]